MKKEGGMRREENSLTEHRVGGMGIMEKKIEHALKQSEGKEKEKGRKTEAQGA